MILIFTYIQMSVSLSDSSHVNVCVVFLTLAAGALAAVDDGQDHGLTLPTGTLQAEETHRSVRVQTIAAALAHRLEVRLLFEQQHNDHRRKKSTESILRVEELKTAHIYVQTIAV